MNENWTDNLLRQMEQYESTQVPDGLWEAIEQELDGGSRAVRVPVWHRLLAACIAIGIVIVGGVLLKPLLTSPGGGKESDVCGLTYDKRMDEKPLTAAADETESAMPMTAVVGPQMVVNHVDTVHEQHQEVAQVTDVVATEPAVEEEAVTESSTSAPQSYSRSEVVPFSNAVHRDAHRGGFKVALYGTQMPQNESLGMNGYLALSKQGIPDNTPHLMSKGDRGTFDYLALLNDGANPVTDARHHQPVRIGFSVGYDIDKRWGISAGVSYTKLKSTLTAGTQSSYYTNDQTIRYIGVPVNLSYNLLRHRSLRLYATAGGMVEWGVGGESIVETVMKNRHLPTEKHDIDDVPVQLSATMGAGAELNVYRSLGIFAEVGAAYYFDNNSKYATIYSTHPLNLNLQFGVRWTLNPTE